MNRIAAILVYLALAGGILWADLWSKEAVFRYLHCEVTLDPETDRPVWSMIIPEPIIAGWLDLEATVNEGAFNGWFRGRQGLLTAISVVAVTIITLLVAIPARSTALMPFALGLLSGGALGNLYDRVQFRGVRDFIKVYRGDWVWPNFNLADSAICVGVGLLFVREFILWRRSRATAPGAEGAGAAHPTPGEAPGEETPAP